MPSPNNSKSKAYLPSRYAQERKPDKTGFQDILNCKYIDIKQYKQKLIMKLSNLNARLHQNSKEIFREFK